MLENFCIFVISNNKSFISQNLKACRSLERKVRFFSPSGFEIKGVSAYRTSNIKFYSVRALKCYLNEKNLIHGRVTATISKFSPQIFETYFRLYGRLTARENYTAGSSIFRKLYLRVFDFFNFYTSGASVLQKLYSGVVKNRIVFIL